jgi:hypothetical protein
MKHIVLLDDRKKSNKAFMDIAKSMKDIKVLTEKEFSDLEDKILYKEMKAAEKQPMLNVAEFKKEILKLRSRK